MVSKAPAEKESRLTGCLSLHMPFAFEAIWQKSVNLPGRRTDYALSVCSILNIRKYSPISSSSHHTVHVPFKVHTIHHTHIQKVPVYKEIVKEVPVVKEVIKEVPVVKEVVKEVPVVKEIIKEVPVIKTVHIPVIKEVKVPVPVHVHDDFSNQGKDWGSHEW